MQNHNHHKPKEKKKEKKTTEKVQRKKKENPKKKRYYLGYTKVHPDHLKHQQQPRMSLKAGLPRTDMIASPVGFLSDFERKNPPSSSDSAEVSKVAAAPSVVPMSVGKIVAPTQRASSDDFDEEGEYVCLGRAKQATSNKTPSPESPSLESVSSVTDTSTVSQATWFEGSGIASGFTSVLSDSDIRAKSKTKQSSAPGGWSSR